MSKFVGSYREIHTVLHHLRDLSATEVAKKSGLSVSTVHAMRSSKTRWPRHETLKALARIAGFRYALVPIHQAVADEAYAPPIRKPPAVKAGRPAIDITTRH